jgi:hypothetical protein
VCVLRRNVLHKGLGYLAVLLAILNIFLGLKLSGVTSGATVLYAIIALSISAFYAWNLVRACRKHPLPLASDPSGSSASRDSDSKLDGGVVMDQELVPTRVSRTQS